MTLPVERQLFSVAEYYKMAEVGILKPSDRVELIKGEIIKMSPIKSFHAGVINFLVEQLNFKLFGKVVVAGQNPIRIGPHSEPEPDVVVAKFRKDRYQNRHPRPADIYLLIEVADSSLHFDRQIKLPLYAEAGIPEYWIVNLPERQIEVFHQPEGTKYLVQEIVRRGETITCSTIAFGLQVEDIFP